MGNIEDIHQQAVVIQSNLAEGDFAIVTAQDRRASVEVTADYIRETAGKLLTAIASEEFGKLLASLEGVCGSARDSYSDAAGDIETMAQGSQNSILQNAYMRTAQACNRMGDGMDLDDDSTNAAEQLSDIRTARSLAVSGLRAAYDAATRMLDASENLKSVLDEARMDGAEASLSMKGYVGQVGGSQ